MLWFIEHCMYFCVEKFVSVAVEGSTYVPGTLVQRNMDGAFLEMALLVFFWVCVHSRELALCMSMYVYVCVCIISPRSHCF